MSVRHKTYILWGLRLDYDDVTYEQIEDFDPDDRDSDDAIVLYDGMSGDYVFVGISLAKTEDYEGFESPVEIPMPTLEDAMRFSNWKNKIEALLGESGLTDAAKDQKLGWHVVTHYR